MAMVHDTGRVAPVVRPSTPDSISIGAARVRTSPAEECGTSRAVVSGTRGQSRQKASAFLRQNLEDVGASRAGAGVRLRLQTCRWELCRLPLKPVLLAPPLGVGFHQVRQVQGILVRGRRATESLVLGGLPGQVFLHLGVA